MGVPAPISAFTPPESREAARVVALQLLRAEWHYQPSTAHRRQLAGASALALIADTRSLWAGRDDFAFYGPSGIGFAADYDQYEVFILGLMVRPRARVPRAPVPRRVRPVA